MDFNLDTIQQHLGITFKNKNLLKIAFTHSSYANDKGEVSNERLEFLGDSILNFIVANQLYKKFKKKNEGYLTIARAEIVSGKSLSATTEKMDLIKFLRTGNGLIGEEARKSDRVKAGLFEAIVAAIYLDGGMKAAEKFIKTNLH